MLLKIIEAILLGVLLVVASPRISKKFHKQLLLSIPLFAVYLVVFFQERLLGVFGLTVLAIAILRLLYKRQAIEAGLVSVALYILIVFINFMTAFRQLLLGGRYIGPQIPYLVADYKDLGFFISYALVFSVAYRVIINGMRTKIDDFKAGHLVMLFVDLGVLVAALAVMNNLYRFMWRSIEGIQLIEGMGVLLFAVINLSIFLVLILVYLLNSYWMTQFNFSIFRSIADLDELTGVMNRQSGLRRLSELYKRSRATGQNFVLCFIDVNNLKVVNDKFGHAEGDRMIQAISQCIDSTLREGDFICRLGGDEFLVAFNNCMIDDAQKAWMRIGSELDRLNFSMEFEYRVSVSHGLVSFEENKRLSLKELIDLADEKMYEHKSKFKSKTV